MTGVKEGTGLATAVIDTDGRLTSCTEQVLELLGMTWPTLQGVHLADLVHPDDHAVTVDAIAFHIEIGGRGDWTEARVRSSAGWLPIEFLPDLSAAARGDAMAVHIRRSQSSAIGWLRSEAAAVVADIADTTNDFGRRPVGDVLSDVLGQLSEISGRSECTIRLIRDQAVWVEAQHSNRLPADRSLELEDVSRLMSMLDTVGFAGFDLDGLADSWSRERRFLASEQLQIMFAVPLRRRGELVGWLEAANHQEMLQLTPPVRDLIVAVGDLLSGSIAEWAPEQSDGELGVVRATQASGKVSQAFVIDQINRRLATVPHGTVAVLRVGLDGFSAATTRLESSSGDTTERVTRAIEFGLDENDLCVALASGGFVVVATVDSARAAVSLAATISEEVDETFVDSLGLSVSIGLALNEPGRSARSMLRSANAGLVSAKRRGRGQVAFELP